MAKKFKSVRIEQHLFDDLHACEALYRKHHPELDGVFLTKSKILYEIMRFYLHE